MSGFTKHDAQPLDDLGITVRAHVAGSFKKRRPFEQGEAAADFVRAHLKLNTHDAVDVFDTVDALGATLYVREVEPENLLALAAWGSRS